MAYSASKAPSVEDEDAQAIASYLEDELATIAAHLADQQITIELQISYVEPKRPRTGMIAYADGTRWNPGAGEGLYVRTSGAVWAKLN